MEPSTLHIKAVQAKNFIQSSLKIRKFFQRLGVLFSCNRKIWISQSFIRILSIFIFKLLYRIILKTEELNFFHTSKINSANTYKTIMIRKSPYVHIIHADVCAHVQHTCLRWPQASWREWILPAAHVTSRINVIFRQETGGNLPSPCGLQMKLQPQLQSNTGSTTQRSSSSSRVITKLL